MTRIFLMILMLSFSANAGNLEFAEQIIAEEITDRLEDYDPDARIEVNIIKGKDDIANPEMQNLVLTSLEFDTERKNFTGYMVANDIVSHEIAGKYAEMVKLPVVNKKLRRDDIIREEDIGYEEIDRDKLSRGYITDELDLIGKSPTRTLFRNRPVLPKQVAAPSIVTRRQEVTMFLENNVLQIQDIGVAMEDGAMGETIRVRNSNSHVIVRAKVVGDNLVEVLSGSKIMASNF